MCVPVERQEDQRDQFILTFRASTLSGFSAESSGEVKLERRDINLPRGTKAHDVFCAGAGLDARRVIVGIAVGHGADRLKAPRVVARVASCGVPECPPAAVLIRVEDVAGAPASDHLPARFQGQLCRAAFSEVTVASDRGAVLLTLQGDYDYGQVKAVHEADIIVVHCPEVELSYWGRRASGAGAVEGDPATTCLAGPVAILVEAAASPAPDAAAPTCWGGVDRRLARFERRSTAVEVLRVSYSRPHRLLAVIQYCQGPCALRLNPCSRTNKNIYKELQPRDLFVLIRTSHFESKGTVGVCCMSSIYVTPSDSNMQPRLLLEAGWGFQKLIKLL